MRAMGAVLVVISLLHAVPAVACRAIFPSREQAFERASAVVTGRVTSSRILEKEGIVEMQVDVEKWWKGSGPKSITVTSQRNTCGTMGEQGQRWVLYLKGAAKSWGTSAVDGSLMLQVAPDVPPMRTAEEVLGKH